MLTLCTAVLTFVGSIGAQEKNAAAGKSKEVAPGIFTKKDKPKIVAKPAVLPEAKPETEAKPEMKPDDEVEKTTLNPSGSKAKNFEELKNEALKPKKKTAPIFRPTLKAKDVIES